MKMLFIIFPLLVLFTGCDFDFFGEENATVKMHKAQMEQLAAITAHSKELQKNVIENVHQKELAEVAVKKELAKIESQKQIEIGRMDQAVRLKELELQKQKEIESMKLQAIEAERDREYAFKRNMLLLAALLILVMSYGLYVLLKRRHENKLRAYNDNLKKYFEEKERRDRMHLAEKIIDKIADGNTPSAQEQKLIEILRGVSSEPDDPPRIDNKNFKNDLPPQIDQ